jgi:hypothetical protein
MRRLLCSALVLSFVGCSSDSGSDPNPVPADATALSSYATTGVRLVAPRMANFEAALPFLLNPGSAGATGTVFTPTGAPDTYTFSVPIDGDGNGSAETTVAGTAAFTGDPAAADIGFGGHLDFAMSTAGGLGNFTGEMDFVLTTAGRAVWGGGTFVEGITGNMTTITIPAATPLGLRPARPGTTSVANVCGYTVQGDAQFEVAGPQGTLASVWQFRSNNAKVTVTGASYTDNNGKATDLPDTEISIPCGTSAGSLDDWNGTFLQDWACLPLEYGQARLTFTVSGGTVHISDEDPPGSGEVATYTATPLPGNPHEVRGFFIGGPAGSTYREDFSWKLLPNSNAFSDVSYYRYVEGPNIGQGGICGGRATRE